MLKANRLIDFDGNKLVKEAFEKHFTDFHTIVIGKVVKVFDDDADGIPHQRFLLQIPGSEQTVLVIHNLEYADRLHLELGDIYRVSGEYVWNRHGGMMHVTHHDPFKQFRDGSAEVIVEKHPNPTPTDRPPKPLEDDQLPYEHIRL